MGAIYEPHICRECPTIGGSVTDRGQPYGPLCDRCFSDEMHIADDEQALQEGALAPAPDAPPICRTCGQEQDRRQTGYDRYVLLEPRIELPVAEVPPGLRWVVGGDGRVINWKTALPSRFTTCRIAHKSVCAHEPCPTQLPAIFTVIWRHNRHRRTPHPLTSARGASRGHRALILKQPASPRR